MSRKATWTNYRKVEFVDPQQLNVDHEYQRFEVPAIVNAIVSDFDVLVFGIVTAGKRTNGELYVTDGQQRTKAACILKEEGRLPGKVVPVVTFPSRGRSHEAELFLKQDNRRRIPDLAKWKAAGVQGEQFVKSVNAFMDKFGLRIAHQNEHAKWPTVACIGRIKKCYRSDKDSLEKALATITTCWHQQSDALREVAIWGVYEFYREFGDSIERSHLERILAATTPSVLLKSVPKTDTQCRWSNGYDRGPFLARAILDQYNYRRAKSRKLVWKEAA